MFFMILHERKSAPQHISTALDTPLLLGYYFINTKKLLQQKECILLFFSHPIGTELPKALHVPGIVLK